MTRDRTRAAVIMLQMKLAHAYAVDATEARTRDGLNVEQLYDHYDGVTLRMFIE